MFASIFGCGYYYLDWARSGQQRRIAGLEALSSKLTAQTVPMRFMVVSRGEEGIRTRIKLYDLAGKELVLLEKTLPGKELFFDFLISPLPSPGVGGDARWLAFPYRVFSDSLPAARGILLLDSYDQSGLPAVYGGQAGSALGAKESAALSAVFARARKAAAGAGSADPSAPLKPPRTSAGYGSPLHKVLSLSHLEEGVEYEIDCRPDGVIEIGVSKGR